MKTSDYEQTRNDLIMKAGITSIKWNLLISLLKFVIGYVTASFSIVIDAVNGLTAVFSGGLMIFEARLSRKMPDEKHPLGYGRIEEISALFVSGLIFFAGITSFVESLKKIRKPELPEYNWITIITLAIFLVVKVLLSEKVKEKGTKLKSKSLFAIGKLAGLDEALSISVLVTVIIYMKSGILLEAWVGIVISGFIIKTGIQMIIDTVSDILGTSVDSTLSKKIKEKITSYTGVTGAFDLIINSYGPEKQIGSVHIEVLDTMTAREIDTISRHITEDILKEFNVLLTGIGVYARNTTDKESEKIQKDIENCVLDVPGVLEVHGFYIDRETDRICFDIVLDYRLKNREEIYKRVSERVEERYPDCEIDIVQDIDI